MRGHVGRGRGDDVNRYDTSSDESLDGLDGLDGLDMDNLQPDHAADDDRRFATPGQCLGLWER